VLEVRPPVRIDKGAAIASFLADAEHLRTAMYVGDVATDVDAFRALGELVAEGRLENALRVGVRSDEGPSQLTELADVVVDGTEGVRELLGALVGE
jgi:trehalose 6-phosphate phosphatase